MDPAWKVVSLIEAKDLLEVLPVDIPGQVCSCGDTLGDLDPRCPGSFPKQSEEPQCIRP
jgi:hypothetical protein